MACKQIGARSNNHICLWNVEFIVCVLRWKIYWNHLRITGLLCGYGSTETPSPHTEHQSVCAEFCWFRCCQPDTWWRHQMATFSTSLALCKGNPPVTSGFPSQWPVTRSFDVLPAPQQMVEQTIETPSRSLWRHCNENDRSAGEIRCSLR